MLELSSLLPDTAEINSQGHLSIGGCDVVELASRFGTPLYIFDEATLRARCAEYREEFSRRYPDTLVIYACKAFINRALARILAEEGLGLDVVSGGEFSIAHSVGFPMEKVYFHGNNKSREELELALKWGVGRIVVDNFHELSLLQGLCKGMGVTQDILLRLSPGIDPHTHRYIATGVLDSKFGFPLMTGQAEEALLQAMAASYLNLIGLHVHLGSLIFEVKPYREAIAALLDFASRMEKAHGFRLREVSPGGGFAIPYTREDPTPATADYAEAVSSALLSAAEGLGLAPPRLVVEPGRAIVGRAGVAVYTVGSQKEIPGLRRYVSVDGGMADNIRPALYGSRYEALMANKAGEEVVERVTLCGKFCESGDILIREVSLPPVAAGDILVIPVSGAYCLPMASNYNSSLKPAILLVKEGEARLIRRRETYEDLVRQDLS